MEVTVSIAAPKLISLDVGRAVLDHHGMGREDVIRNLATFGLKVTDSVTLNHSMGSGSVPFSTLITDLVKANATQPTFGYLNKLLTVTSFDCSRDNIGFVLMASYDDDRLFIYRVEKVGA
jgi:hypothetical protein